jgi:maltose O-acetyltransferase
MRIRKEGGIAKLLRFAFSNQRRFRSYWNKWTFLATELPYHRSIELGDDITFYVPVRGGGCGSLTIGARTNLGFPLAPRLGSGEIMLQARTPEAEVVIGIENWFNNNAAIIATRRVVIGNGCQIGDYVSVIDSDFHEINPTTRNQTSGKASPVTIGNNVWLGSRVMVLKGVTIGDNSVIAAMSIVTKSIPSNSIAAGMPAKVIRIIE